MGESRIYLRNNAGNKITDDKKFDCLARKDGKELLTISAEELQRYTFPCIPAQALGRPEDFARHFSLWLSHMLDNRENFETGSITPDHPSNWFNWFYQLRLNERTHGAPPTKATFSAQDQQDSLYVLPSLDDSTMDELEYDIFTMEVAPNSSRQKRKAPQKSNSRASSGVKKPAPQKRGQTVATPSAVTRTVVPANSKITPPWYFGDFTQRFRLSDNEELSVHDVVRKYGLAAETSQYHANKQTYFVVYAQSVMTFGIDEKVSDEIQDQTKRDLDAHRELLAFSWERLELLKASYAGQGKRKRIA